MLKRNTIVILSLTLSTLFLAGCFSPVPVRVIDKPTLSDPQKKKDIKVCLIVKDERPKFIAMSNTLGTNHQTIFYIPASQAFLAHLEHLDSVVAYHVRKRLQNAGYDVVKVYPSATPEQLSEKEIEKSDLDQEALDKAWKHKGELDDPAMKDKIGKDNEKGVIVEKLENKYLSPWGNDINTQGADIVVELKIRKFWTIHGYFGSKSWASANFAVCSNYDPKRTVLYGNKVVGFGYCFSFFTPLTPVADMGVSINTSYWMIMYQIENEISSNEFALAVENAVARRKKLTMRK
jgi:hypothetical protein